MTHDHITTRDKLTAAFAAVYTALIFIAVGAFGMHTYDTALRPLPKGPPHIVCYTMPQSDLSRYGWKPVPEADKGLIADAVRRGKLQWREEESLMCYPYAKDETPWGFVAKQQWWKAK